MTTPIKTARALRQRMTPEEKLLWRNLRNRQFKTFKFRRQHPIPYQQWVNKTSFYVADFYCAEKKVVIELDGKYHDFPDQLEYDKARDSLLNHFGMYILRIRNEELKNMEAVMTKIEGFLTPGPTPQVQRGEVAL